jgi:hypothetical protein
VLLCADADTTRSALSSRKVAVNEHGYPIGEGHHRSTIADIVIVRWRDLREYHNLTIPEIARREGASEATVRKVVNYQRRAQFAQGYREAKDNGSQEG